MITKINDHLSYKFRRKTLFLLGISLFLCKAALAETLKTPNFIVNIVRHCPEGEVVCYNVSYTGTSLKTGESIQLTGKTVYRLCFGSVTPCQFLGYEFTNGTYRYFVTESGAINIYKKGKLLLKEQGAWTNLD